MKNTSSIDFATLNIIYKKYKYHLIYISVIIVCFIVLIFFTLPEFSQISQMGKERKIEEEKLKVLKNNLGILQGTDNTLLESQLQAVTTALPESKDYEGILNAISLASSKSGASLNDYEFGVGSLSGDVTPAAGFPYINLELIISASQEQTVSFLKSLSETVPLSQITSIKQTPGRTSIDMIFYYKSSIPGSVSEGTALSNLNSEDKELVSKISLWNTSLSGSPVEDQAGTPSASPF